MKVENSKEPMRLCGMWIAEFILNRFRHQQHKEIINERIEGKKKSAPRPRGGWGQCGKPGPDSRGRIARFDDGVGRLAHRAAARHAGAL